ncbi:autotransporter beta-domain-containing protein [Campylobacter jejuni subsp. doylei]|uniref:Autotransporter beta-domain-containing protein n=1 Tax=Campylobacter jejuni subsp. doylei TaxID=32021 RepID=A0A448J6N4_CAMJU|nr:autotransporter beta-domain-containing protein [Campylobacter jejuni subsp. doylei]
MKNTSLVKTLGGGVKEYSFNSKKIVLSLATISFLASYANASTTTGTSGTTDACPTTSSQARSGSSSTNGSTYNCTINSLYNSGNQGITLSSYQTSNVTIGSSGTIQAQNYTSNGHNAIELKGQNGDTRTLENFINHGTIKGKIGIAGVNGFSGTITVRTFDNEGTIKGYIGIGGSGTITVGTFENKSGGTIDGDIYMATRDGSGTMSIEKFSNEGTITTSNNNDGVIYFEGTTRIQTFHNKQNGTIESKNGKNSITVKAQGSQTPILENFINEGTIKGKIGIENHKNNGGLNGTITVGTFENKSNGTIDGDIYMGIWKGSGTISIENFNNEGTISGKSRNEKGVHFEAQGSAKVHIKTFHNKNTGTIESKDRQGVYFQGNVHVETFHNEGFITGTGNGNNGSGENGVVYFGNNVTIQNFHNKSGGTIKNSSTITTTTLNNNNTRSMNGHPAIVLKGSSSTIETFINEGTIGSRVDIESQSNGTITVRTFENKGKGTINGRIYMGQNGTISVENFKNSGTINGGDHQAIFLQGNHTRITTFENSGTILGKGDGEVRDNYYLAGAITMSYGTIENFKNSGTIKNETQPNHIKLEYKLYNPAGVKLNYATVKTFENTGLISGPIGFITTKGTIENFINKGTIESTGKDGREPAIKIQTENQNPSTITHFINEGIIKSSSNGIMIESGNKIEALTNKGTIETELNGISFFDDGVVNGVNSSPDNTELGKIVLESGSSIKAKKKGIDIDHQTARSIRVDGIEVKAGASVSGDEAGIYLGKGKEITAPITISGTVSGGNAGIVNEGRMAKGIINDGEAELVISNQGLVEEDDKGNTVANNGSGSVRIKEWVVTTNEETGRLRTVHVGGSNTENVKVNSITVDQSNLNLEELNDITNIISGVSTNNIADSVKTNGGGEISLSFDPLSGRLSTDVQLNASIAGASFRSSLATASRRATFIDNVMANAMQSFSLGSDKAQKIALSEKGNLYADASDYIKNDSIMNDYIKNDLTQGSYNSNKEHALFILPYFSSQSVELSLNEESKGHTKGTIIGYSTLKDSGIYGVYAGYEDKKMDSTYFGINDISYYTGLKYFNTLFTTAKGQEVYIKAQVQGALIKNDFTKKIGKNEAKAKAHSYTYGINTAWGMNFIADKNIFSPEAGFAYEGSYTEAFSMQDTRGKATVQGGERTYANHLNLFSTKTSFTWFRDWLPNLKTSVELGAKFNVNPKVKARARFGDKKVSNEFHLPRVRKFASTSLIVPVNEAFYFSLNYNGMFDEKGNTHTGFAQFNYLW